MADIASRSHYATTCLVNDLHHIARSEKSIASPDTIRRHLNHMDHILDLQCHPIRYVCNPCKVEGKLIGEVVVKMVGKVIVKMMRAIVVRLSRHYLLQYPLNT